MRSILAATLALAVASSAAKAQSVIDPGMSKSDVVAKLGTPLTERMHEGRTYLFFENKVESRVGMNDLVVLENGRVVDAIFRNTGRRYSGTSSSPKAIPADVAYWGKGAPARKAAPAPLKLSPPPAKAAPKAAPGKTTAPAAKAPPPAKKTPPPPAKKNP